MIETETLDGFMQLFRGYPNAYGTGKGGWVHSAPDSAAYLAHLEGRGTGLGIGPLLPDGTCWFAAIDLDKPDFDLAKQMMQLLPGVSWLERSRSGNAHVLVFFSSPIEAWIVRGIMREALAALGQRGVEVFPKSDQLLPGMVGNYLNLPCFGDTRPIIGWQDDEGYKPGLATGATTIYVGENATVLANAFKPQYAVVEPNNFVRMALVNRNDPDEWRKRARWLGVPSPEERQQTKTKNFGESPNLHMCGQYVIEHRSDNPVTAGHRAVVFFSLAKMLANWSEIDDDEALNMMALVNDESPDPIPAEELGRIYQNAVRGEFTSTGCDDPLFFPYRHPECKIGA